MASLKLSILNVGHGDFIYCETPLGDKMIIDCGYGEVTPSVFLSKLDTIDELQITHPHTDHFDDIIKLSSKKIRSLRCPNIDHFKDDQIGWKKNDAKKIQKLKELRSSIPIDNDAIKTDANFSHQVWTPNIDPDGNPNNVSLITLLTYKGFKILMGGDLPKKGWLNLLEDKGFQNSIKGTDILKASHHGRDVGYCKELFDVISPKLCIVSDKALEKDNKNTCCVGDYTASIKNNGGGIEFFKVLNHESVGTRYVLTTRSDNSIFMNITDNENYYIRTQTNWQ